jgi:hypothetical protein
MKSIHLALISLFSAAALAQAPPTTTRVRGSLEAIDAGSMVVKDRSGREVRLKVADDLSVTEVLPIDPSAIQSGSFVGTTAIPGSDGALSALEVHVFDEAARGRGEGHRPFDLQPGSTMTNATVAKIAPVANGRKMTLRYKGGEQTIVVPDGVPVITMRPGDRSLLVPGAKLTVTVDSRSGTPTATRALVGRNGFAPPV